MFVYSPSSGESLYTCIENSIAKASRLEAEVEFTFNGTTVRVQPTSHKYDIGKIWTLKRKIIELASFYRR